MRYLFTIAFIAIVAQFVHAQVINEPFQNNKKGKFYIYWGWNNAKFTKSDIQFMGNDYNFSIQEVVAKDRQSDFNFDTYLNPAQFTTPQYNFRMGYFFSNNWDISIGMDHMKYVMQQNQVVKLSGHIANSGTEFDGEYSNQDQKLTSEFLEFEHTDGLNYVNLELRRNHKLYTFGKTSLNLTEGVGFGLLIPKSNTKLMGNARHDEFHLAGYGLGAMAGINLTFYDIFFAQAEIKGGYINMSDIRTTRSESDKASQYFYYGQVNLVFGANINLDIIKRHL